MPSSPPKRCAHYRCNEFAIQGTSYCIKHNIPRHERDEREPSSRRGYDADWRELRSKFLWEHPLCEVCGREANVAHHIVPIDEGGARLDEDNLQALCFYHHEKHHGRAK